MQNAKYKMIDMPISPRLRRTMQNVNCKMQNADTLISTQVEKDNACDRVDASEEQCKAARVKILSFLLSF